MKVRFTPAARAEYLATLAYLRAHDRGAARRFRTTSGRALRRLGRFPDSGRRIPEFPDLPFREVIVAPYRFFYRQSDKVVWVVAVWHGARLPSPP